MDIVELLTEDRDYGVVIEQFRQAFNAVIETYLSQKADEAQAMFPPLAQQALQGFLQTYTMRGKAKRIRPLLFCCGYLCLGGRDSQAILRASISIELLQTALLIHDDIVDRGEERRQGKTMHRLWEDHFRKNRYKQRYEDDKTHFGISMAIILGDISSGLAYEVLGNYNFPADHELAAIQTFSEVIHRVAIGEMLDIDLAMKELSNVTEQDILKMYELKTSGYSTEGPLHIGAVLGGATRKQLQLLSAYAVPLGIAFQIQDDLLGMFGRYEDIGKDEGSDLAEGKRTLLLLKAWQQSQNIRGARTTLKNALRHPENTHHYLSRVREIIVDTGALDHAFQLIDQQIGQVQGSLKAIERELGREARSALQKVATHVEQRQDYRKAVGNYGENPRS